MKSKFSEQAKLMCTDTVSIIYHITTPHLYMTINSDSHKFDTSDYPSNNGNIMKEFVALRAKLYSYRLQGIDINKNRAKGVRASTLNTINFNDYKNYLFHHENIVKS